MKEAILPGVDQEAAQAPVEAVPEGAHRCPECGEVLMWENAGFTGVRASCCRMPWVLDSAGEPLRAWGRDRYPEKRMNNYETWRPRGKAAKAVAKKHAEDDRES